MSSSASSSSTTVDMEQQPSVKLSDHVDVETLGGDDEQKHAPATASSSSSSSAVSAPDVRPSSFYDLRIAVVGNVDSGKCFARGTKLRLLDGHLIAVEDVTAGTRLMGDDSTARIVTAGTLTADYGKLYTIEPHWEGVQPFTVNEAHILVIRINRRPDWLRADLQRSSRVYHSWTVRWYELDSHNMLQRRERRFTSRAAAQVACVRRRRIWTPIAWEVSVGDYLRLPQHQRADCQLFTSSAVTFQSSELTLTQQLMGVLQQPPTPAQVSWAAWALGLWVAGGPTGKEAISQDEPARVVPESQWEILARLMQYEQLFGEGVHQVADSKSPANQSYWSKFGLIGQQVGCGGASHASSIFHRLLLAYGILHDKSIPHAWLCDGVDVRRAMLAGIIDGSGYCDVDTAKCELRSEKCVDVEGYKTLAASLGLRTSAIGAQVPLVDEAGETTSIVYRVFLSGPIWDVVQLCAVTQKVCPKPETASVDQVEDADHSCFGFNVIPRSMGEYFGFAVHGGANRRFLLEDFTVTHNVSPLTHSQPGSK